MRSRTTGVRVWPFLAVAMFILLAAPTRSWGAIGPELLRIGTYGTGAGELRLDGGGIAADPTSGHLFISEQENDRISEFTAFGDFVKAWGYGVLDGSNALQQCTTACQAGKPGSGVGQLGKPNGIALAPNGNLYVFERQNHRVQVFDQGGNFVLMFGGGVNITDGTDVCTAADVTGGDVCGAGSEGTGSGEFAIPPSFRSQGDYIDFGPDDLVYVGDKDRVQKFEADGDHVASLPLPESGNPGALAVDPVSGDVYFAYAIAAVPTTKSFRLDENTGAVIDELPTTAVEGMAMTPDGTLFVSDDPAPLSEGLPVDNPLLREIDDEGVIVESCCPSTTKNGETVRLPSLGTNVVTFAGGVDLYVLHSSLSKEVGFVEVRGPAPDKWPPPEVPPTIEAQFASGVEETSATLKAQINPNFWPDTEYWVEYGLAPCNADGCGEETAKVPLGAGIVKKSITTDGVDLTGLASNTTYHFRFVSESGGGGPAYGIDPDGPKGPGQPTFEDGLEGAFTTTSPPVIPPSGGCSANEAFRTGLSAGLWECRAYELVSPVDKLGGDILVVGNINGIPSRLDQATPEGEKITYSSYRSFGDAQSAPYSTQYIASREAGKEWSTHAISPPREGRIFTGPRGLDSQFKAFSEDLGFGWMVFDTSPVLATGGVPDYPNLYRRDNTSDTYQAMSTAKPTPTSASEFNFEVQGASADSTHTVFRAKGKVTTTASNQQLYQVYENVNGTLRLVSVKPAGGPITVETTVGSLGGTIDNGREANVEHAVSEDGSRIYFSEASGSNRLYVRTDGTTTTQVSTGAATYWNATPDGAEALYVEAGKLRLFDLATKTSSTLVEEGVGGVMGASEDLSRIYFTSTADLAGAAEAGQPNLYLYEEGQPLRFVVTLSGLDTSTLLLSPVALSPRRHISRVSPDGNVALFASRAPLTGEDNADQENGEPLAEVFRYDAGTEGLACISCLGNGARADGRQLRFENLLVNYYYASLLPGYEFLHATRALSDDGGRAYFNSLNPLVPQDANGKQDVYEWEAPGKGQCSASAPNYRPASAGCVNLISTGTSPKDSEFVDASSDGRDVFFLTEQSLVAQDPGQFDLYDAREGGGLPTPPVPGPECEDEAQCRPQATPAPPAPGPGASQGPSEGNVKPTKPKKCPKGKARRKGKCVKKHHKRHKKHKAAKRNKGASK